MDDFSPEQISPTERRCMTEPCPCGSGASFGACCLPVLEEPSAARTPEALMRSRYTAFAHRDLEHLLSTWEPAARPPREELAASLASDTQWVRLTILDAPPPQGDSGTVDFAAAYREEGGRGVLREHSRFVHRRGRWFYVDGDLS